MEFYSVFGADMLCLGGYGTAGPHVLQMWIFATGKGSMHHLMSPDQRVRQPDSPRVVPSAFHQQCPPASQGQHSLHTPLHNTTFKEQFARFLIPFFSPPLFPDGKNQFYPEIKPLDDGQVLDPAQTAGNRPCLG